MKISLVHPTGFCWLSGQSKDIGAMANRLAPIGLLSLSAYLEQHGHTVHVHDCMGPYKNIDHTAAIVKQAPEIVGFSTTTSSFLDGYSLAVEIKKKLPHAQIIFGGVHVSSIGARLLEDYPSIDFLCMGEGEQTLKELADGTAHKDIAGLVYRDEDEVRTNFPRMHLPDLDSLPFPDYSKLYGFPKNYHLPLFSYVNAPGATMITSRGCPYQCSYCDRSVFGKGFRYNSAEYVYEHMKYLCEGFGVRHINIYDDLFTTNRKRIFALCEMLISKPLGISFNCAVRVGHADDELLSKLKSAGCLMVSIGIESGDESMLVRHKAGVELDAVRDTVKNIKKHGLRVKGLFMMGLPGETEQTARKTSDFVLSLGLDDMNMSKFCPFPGAPLYADIEKEGTLDEDWNLMNCLNFVFVPKDVGTKERMDELYNEHIRRFYQNPAWRKQFRKRMWQHRHSLYRLVANLPSFLSAKRAFE